MLKRQTKNRVCRHAYAPYAPATPFRDATFIAADTPRHLRHFELRADAYFDEPCPLLAPMIICRLRRLPYAAFRRLCLPDA